jgi:hypothetical protein
MKLAKLGLYLVWLCYFGIRMFRMFVWKRPCSYLLLIKINEHFFKIITFNSNAFRPLFTPSSVSSWLFFVTHQNDVSTYWFYDHSFCTEFTLFQSEFCAKTVILESVSAYISLMCYKEQSRTPWRRRGQTQKRDGVKKWSTYKTCGLIVG